MNLKKLFELPKNNYFKILILILAGFVIVLGIFTLGERIGYRRASFSFKNGDNYYRAFEHRNTNSMSAPQFSDANGAAGRIISASNSVLVIQDRDGTEKTIMVGPDTVIRRLRDTVMFSDIKIEEYVVVVGTPNTEGTIDAKLIRLLPPSEKMNMNHPKR